MWMSSDTSEQVRVEPTTTTLVTTNRFFFAPPFFFCFLPPSSPPTPLHPHFLSPTLYHCNAPPYLRTAVLALSEPSFPHTFKPFPLHFLFKRKTKNYTTFSFCIPMRSLHFYRNNNNNNNHLIPFDFFTLRYHLLLFIGWFGLLSAR
uniref:Uncharacterized protein n=1 Tax=Trypanosoma vivax (strain Y486) TaxID=1055687 RepID=G0U5L3_TRYVY|nr:hypothetical protein, unlikely [Trypanosoma vivax Y486]